MKPQLPILGSLATLGALALTAVSLAAAPTAAHAVSSDRHGGADRYATSAAVAAAAYPGHASTVWVASGANFPDALSAGAAAAKQAAPLLLTAPGSLPAAISSEISKLAPTKIVIAGGIGAVSTAVGDALRKIAPVTRVSGADRYATSIAIAKYAFTTSGSAYAYAASGADYPDALSSAGAAASRKAPVLLVPGGAASAPAAVTAELAALKTTRLWAVGGSAVLSDGVVRGLAANGRTVTRAAGADRYATSAAVAATGVFAKANGAVIASGQAFPDALVASTYARGTRPVLLAQKICVPAATHAAEAGYASRHLIGGTGALWSTVAADTTCTSSVLATLKTPPNRPRPGCLTSTGCTEAQLVAAIDQAHASEGIPALALPSDYASLSTQQQLIAVIDAERVARGLPRLTENATLDADAAAGARAGTDPQLGHVTGWGGSIWAATSAASVILADYLWMYDDGPGGTNIDCTGSDTGGCWGHRNVILGWTATISKGAVVDGSLWVGSRIGTGFATITQEGRRYASYAGIVAQQ